VTTGLELGINDLPVYTDFVTASAGRNKSYAFNLGFKLLEQIVSQAHGPVRKVSNGTVNNLDLHHGAISWSYYPKIILLLA
jgi:hypothetical protein